MSSWHDDESLVSGGSESAFDVYGAAPMWEEQLVMRAPTQHVAERIRAAIAAAADSRASSSSSASIPSLSLVFTGPRTAVLTLDHEEFEATLVDLPCILETHRSNDGSNLMKSNDVGQMLIIGSGSSSKSKSRRSRARSERRQYNSEFQCYSGLTPPTHDIWKKWSVRRYDYSYFEDAELEVLKIMQTNEEGEHCELVDADEVDRLDELAFGAGRASSAEPSEEAGVPDTSGEGGRSISASGTKIKIRLGGSLGMSVSTPKPSEDVSENEAQRPVQGTAEPVAPVASDAMEDDEDKVDGLPTPHSVHATASSLPGSPGVHSGISADLPLSPTPHEHVSSGRAVDPKRISVSYAEGATSSAGSPLSQQAVTPSDEAVSPAGAEAHASHDGRPAALLPVADRSCAADTMDVAGQSSESADKQREPEKEAPRMSQEELARMDHLTRELKRAEAALLDAQTKLRDPKWAANKIIRDRTKKQVQAAQRRFDAVEAELAALVAKQG